MGKSSTRVVARMLALMVVVMAVETTHARMSKEACRVERDASMTACKTVLYGQLPSPECCERVRAILAECVCPLVTPRMAALVDVNHVIRLVEGCGRRVPHHFKCGSITTP